MNIGVNLFGPKTLLYDDFEGTLAGLKKCGFTSLEMCLVFGEFKEPVMEIPEEVRKNFKKMSGGIWSLADAEIHIPRCRELGFNIISAHFMGDTSSPEALLGALPQMIAFAVKWDIKCYVLSLMKTLKDIKPYAPALKQMTEALDKHHINLAYHNHEIECIQEEGTTGLDYLLEQCPLLKLEPDVGWAKFAGVSPVELMKKYQDRIVLLHLKDIRSDASPETRHTCFSAIGEGSIPLAEIIACAKECNLPTDGVIIDQDDSPGNLLDDLAVGVSNIMKVI